MPPYKPTYRLVFEAIGAAIVTLLGFALFTVGFIANALIEIFRRR